MKNLKYLRAILFLLLLLLLTACTNNNQNQIINEDIRIITDMLGREVEVKNQVDQAVIIEWEGLATKAMKIFGFEDRIVGVDDYAKKNTFRNKIVPHIKKVPDIGSAWSGVNYETLASLKPDIVFMELWITNDSERKLHQTAIDKIEALGIPVITFLSPSCFEEPNIETAWRHISIVGEVFHKQKEAQELISNLNEKIQLIVERTKDIGENKKANVLIFATSNYVMGKNSIQSYFLTDIINANNVVPSGTFVTVSEEQMLKYDPDVLVVLGHDGFLDLDVIYSGKHCGINWNNVRDMKAIQNKEVVSLGYEEWRATIETPIGLLKMAKAIYPELFQDIDIEEEELKMYMEDYGMEREEALNAIQAQKFTAILDVR